MKSLTYDKVLECISTNKGVCISCYELTPYQLTSEIRTAYCEHCNLNSVMDAQTFVREMSSFIYPTVTTQKF
jgi:transcription elongation factor Elf1